jgi:hypothetical protein
MRIMAEPPKKTGFNSILNPITLLTSSILVIGLILAGLVIVFFGRTKTLKLGVSPEITIIAAPTLTPNSIEPPETLTPTPTSIFFLPEGTIGVGAYVQVTGTQGAGLRMRSEPGLDGAINFTALDSEAFLVIDGPVEADGYLWWHLEAPYDQTRNGWSAGDFLTPIEEVTD